MTLQLKHIQVETLAAAFQSFGLKSGDHVAIWGFNSVEWYLSFLAVAQAGLVAVSGIFLFIGL